MLKHIQKEHKDEKSHDISFKWTVSSKFIKPLERQMTEAVNIAKAPPDESLNSKGEYNSHSIKRFKFQSETQDFQCFECSRKFKHKDELKQHFDVNHVRITCEMCEYVAYGKRDFQNHGSTVHKQ